VCLQGLLEGRGGSGSSKAKQLTFEIFFPRPGSGTPYYGAQYRAARGKVRAAGLAVPRQCQQQRLPLTRRRQDLGSWMQQQCCLWLALQVASRHRSCPPQRLGEKP